MKYFIDTEFIENGPFEPVTLVSIGIVAGDGREYYAVSSNFNDRAANDWVKANVLPHLGDSPRKPLTQIAKEIFEFVSFDVTKPEFWGYYADYDWVVFCQIFGTMINLPEGWPMFCRDLKQWAVDLGNPKLPEQNSTEHNALNDARWNKTVWEFLAASELSRGQGPGPRCPRCTDTDLALDNYVVVVCSNGHETEFQEFGELAQFFRPVDVDALAQNMLKVSDPLLTYHERLANVADVLRRALGGREG